MLWACSRAFALHSFYISSSQFTCKIRVFTKIFKISADCKYGNCTHRHEPGCAVRKAVEEHLISESRYTSYLNMLEDKEEGKYRAAY